MFYSDTSPEEGGKIPESALLRVELNKIDSIGLGDPHAQQISSALVNTPLPERIDPHGSYPPAHDSYPPPHGGVPSGFGGFSSGFGGRYQGRERRRRRRISDRDATPRKKAGDGRGRAIDNRRAATVEGRAAFPSRFTVQSECSDLTALAYFMNISIRELRRRSLTLRKWKRGTFPRL